MAVNLDSRISVRLAALLLLGLATAVQLVAEREGGTFLRSLVFDGYQKTWPREVERFPVRVIDVDEESLRRYGQWPWPRHRIASLVEEAARRGALAVGIDVIMSEAGRFSLAAMARDQPGLEPELLKRLEQIPSNDLKLGNTLSQVPSVVARVGRPFVDVTTQWRKMKSVPIVAQGGDPEDHLVDFPGVTLNVEEVERGASGHGLVNAIFSGDGVVRRVPVLATVAGEVTPSLALELLRVATGTPFLKVHTGKGGVQGVTLGTSFLPLDPDGGLTLHFAPSHPQRRVSAAKLLSGELPADALSGQVAIIGVTALGTADAPPTPISGRMDGVEVQAQVVESLLEGKRLERPSFAGVAELAALVLAGLLLITIVPPLGPRRGLVLAGGVVLCLGGAAAAAFATRHWLLDPSVPMISTAAVCAVLMVSLLVLERRRARALNAELERQRVASARLAGELDAARNIQMGILPDPARIPGMPASVSVAAQLEPARSVGGDLYDLFMVDEHRLFFAVGDVSGKGIPASLFMALSKSLCKSVVMRAEGTVSDRLTIANAEIARENPEMLFVTVVAGLLDTVSGELDLCVAGHDAPWLLRAGEAPRELETIGGPPLCVMDDFEYPAETFQLEPGDTLLLSTDGITEAMDPADTLYGRARLEAVLVATKASASAQDVVDAVTADVVRFADGAEPNDDITVMVLTYRGPETLEA